MKIPNENANVALTAKLDRLADERVTAMTDEEIRAEAVERIYSIFMQAIEEASRITRDLRQQRAVTHEMLNAPMGLIYGETRLSSNANLDRSPTARAERRLMQRRTPVNAEENAG